MAAGGIPYLAVLPWVLAPLRVSKCHAKVRREALPCSQKPSFMGNCWAQGSCWPLPPPRAPKQCAKERGMAFLRTTGSKAPLDFAAAWSFQAACEGKGGIHCFVSVSPLSQGTARHKVLSRLYPHLLGGMQRRSGRPYLTPSLCLLLRPSVRCVKREGHTPHWVVSHLRETHWQRAAEAGGLGWL